MSQLFTHRVQRLQRFRARTFAFLKRTLPSWRWLDRLLLSLQFMWLNGRPPRGVHSADACFSDLMFEKSTTAVWSDLDRRVSDRVTAPDAARALSSTVKFARREAVIDVPPNASTAELQHLLQPWMGRMLIAKPAHGCAGHVYLHQAPSDQEWALFRRMAVSDYYDLSRERQYHGMAKRIVVEEVLGGVPRGIIDYKFVCIFGRPVLVSWGVGVGAARRRGFFSLPEWHGLSYDLPADIRRSYFHDRFETDTPRPKHLDEMMNIASELSAPFDVVRIDLYSLPDGVYFGEFTLTPGGGTMPLTPNLGNDRAVMAEYRAALERRRV
jgi:hypothetical protein